MSISVERSLLLSAGLLADLKPPFPFLVLENGVLAAEGGPGFVDGPLNGAGGTSFFCNFGLQMEVAL
jgi:hypothetical protein